MSRPKYPEDAEARKVEGRVTMRVIVEPRRPFRHPRRGARIARSGAYRGGGADRGGSPHWKPGAVRGENGETLRPVRVMYTLSVAFKVRPRAQDPIPTAGGRRIRCGLRQQLMRRKDRLRRRARERRAPGAPLPFRAVRECGAENSRRAGLFRMDRR